MTSRLTRRLTRNLTAAAAAVALAVTSGTTAAVAAPAAPAGPAAPAAAAAAPKVTHTVTYDQYSLKIDGKRTFIWAGEFHYWRLPSPSLWLDVLQKMKAAGYNAVTIYFDWGFHSPAPGVYDFSGVRDVDKLLDMAAQVGLYVIARQGPYINAETDGGGFPGWLNRMDVAERTDDPAYLHYADQWLSHIDPIIARHQLTNGTGTVILDQVENEFFDSSAAGRQYMADLEAKYRADGITVPLTGNHSGTFSTGTGALDIDGPDSYPQGFNCSTPDTWAQAPYFLSTDVADRALGKPLYLPEFQGGAFDPWGGPGYPDCQQLTGPDFENVFYDTNIASGATLMSYYMTYGGTSWGYLPYPGVYTSYDYGAAISEDRTLTAKYEQQKLTGYFLAADPSLDKTDQLATAPPGNSALWLQGRVNPDNGSQLLVLRQADSTSTADQTTHLSLDLSGRSSFTDDDASPALAYTGSWTHATGQDGDFGGTESWTDQAGASMSVTFTGSSVSWIAPKDANHGITDVSVDGQQVAQVDGYSASKQYELALYSVHDLPAGQHTLTLTATGTKNPQATGTFTNIDAIDVPPASPDVYPVVPQQPGTSIDINGRASDLLLANYSFGGQQLQYSTSQLMTQATIGGQDTALFYNPAGSDGETVLRYSSQPTVSVVSGGPVQTTWDAARGDLRLNYVHNGLTQVRISGGGRPDLDLLLADTATAEQFWQDSTSAGPVLVRGPELVRSAAVSAGTLKLTGDTTATTKLSVWAPASVRTVTWNGKPVHDATLAGPKPVSLPSLTWKSAPGSPESQLAFDDSSWTIADHTTSQNPSASPGLPVLYADDYGFHSGDVWYRGHFTATGTETSITLGASTGNSTGQYMAWLNGTLLGTGSTTSSFAVPPGVLRPGRDNVIAVLVENMGHDEGTGMGVRGLTGARVNGSLATITWRIQGQRGGEHPVDTVRGPLNTGGLYGERTGETLPGYPDGSWAPATLPAAASTPGVTMYRSHFSLNLPKDQDVPVALAFSDNPAKQYRVQIYLNGWNMGLYVNNVGPQHDFQLPAGLLRTRGSNTLALAVWSDNTTSGLGSVSLVAQADVLGGVPVQNVSSPGWNPVTYAAPSTPATVTVGGQDSVTAGATTTVTATVAVPAGKPAAHSARVTLNAPSGFTVAGDATVALGQIRPGSSASASWQVTVPASSPTSGGVLTATAALDGKTVRGGHTVSVPPPPPTGTVFVSDLPFTSTNGWGPVERDTSNGEQAAGDGHTISIDGMTFAKGLGTNSVSDITVFTGGQCSSFSAFVGVDDEENGGGSVTFSVLADGTTLATTPVLRGGQPGQQLTVNITGAQDVDLVVGDGGDGNGEDHADWGNAQLVCNS